MPQLQATANAEPAVDARAENPGPHEMQTDFITASGLPDYYCVLGVRLTIPSSSAGLQPAHCTLQACRLW